MQVCYQTDTQINANPSRCSTFLITLGVVCAVILFAACAAQPTVMPLPVGTDAPLGRLNTPLGPTVPLGPMDATVLPTHTALPSFTPEPTRAVTQLPIITPTITPTTARTDVSPTPLYLPTPGAGDMGGRLLPAQFVIPPPHCTGITPAQTEGPYYKANTPERTSLIEAGMDGTIIIVTGYVLTRDCKPIANAWLDFWQADAQGQYDNAGYRMRGHQFTDADGRYVLETVLPGLYPGRTRHIHVKVRAPDGSTLTTQLYFPEDAERNRRDGIYRPGLLVTWLGMQDGRRVAVYNFVLDVAGSH